jgi:hypothetical protein
MMRFTVGLGLLIITLIVGIYSYTDQLAQLDAKERGVAEALEKRDAGKNLQVRIRELRKSGLVAGEDQKFTIERLLNIGAPGLEWRFIGQPRPFASNRALYRHTFRITGAASYAQLNEVVRRLATLPGFAPYRACFGCGLPPKDAPEGAHSVQLEGYVYVYDPATFY